MSFKGLAQVGLPWRAVEAELIPLAPTEAPMVVLSQPVFWPLEPAGRRIPRVLINVSRSADFRRLYCSALEAALEHLISPETVRKWVHEGKLAAVRAGAGGRLFVDRHELAAFLKTLPKPGTKTPARLLKHIRMMARRRLRKDRP
jgi:hypothetical protein